MDSPSHIRPLFGNTPVTAAHSLAAFATPKKKTDTHVETTSSSEGWTTKDYFLYGTAGLGALGAAYAGQATFRPAVGKLIALASGNKPPPLSPASRLYAKITSALDYYLKPLVRGMAVLGGAGLGAMMLGPSAFLRSGEREAVRTETAAVRGRTRSLSLSRQSSNPNAPRRITRSLSLSSASGRGRSTEIRPLDSSITSAISAIRPSTATPPPNPSSLERSGNESNQQGSDTPHFSLSRFWEENNLRPNQRQGNASAHLETQAPSSSESRHSSILEIDTPSTSENNQVNSLKDFWRQNQLTPNQGRTTHKQQTSISGENVANSSDSSPASAMPENNFLRAFWKDLNPQEDILSRQSVHNTHSSTSVSSSESLGSTSSLPHEQNLKRPARSPEQENQELLNHLPCPLSIPENSEPLLTSNHSLPTRSNSVKGKEKEVKQVETPHPDYSRDSANLPFSPDELSSRLQQIKRVNSFNGESSSSASSSAFNSQVSTGLINMEESARDTRSPFVVSPSPSSTPSVYATPDRGRSTTSSTAPTPYFTPREQSPVRELENHTQSVQDNAMSSSQTGNSSIDVVTSESSNFPFITHSTFSQADNTLEASSSTIIQKNKDLERNNPSENHDSELLNYKLSSSRNPENLQRIIEKGVSQKALTETLYRICCTYNNDNSYPLLAEVKMLLSAGARENAFDSLLALLRHNRVDAQAAELLLEAGADPRNIDHTGRNAMETLSRQYPMIITKPEERFSPRNYSEEKCTTLKNLLMTYADWHDALDAKDPQKLRNILNNNPDFKIPLAGDPTSSMAERLLFNPENSKRIAHAFGQETPDFVKRVLNVPLDVDGFSNWAIKILHPPLSLRVVNQPELITGLQYCLGKTREETEAFIQKAIQKEFHHDFEKVRSNTLGQFAPESQRLVELSAKHETPNGFIGPRADIKNLLAHEMADKAAQRVMDDIHQANNLIE